MEAKDAANFVIDLLSLLVTRKGSDLFLIPGAPPSMKVDGELMPVAGSRLTPDHTLLFARAIMSEKQYTELERNRGVNFAISPLDTKRKNPVGRFRCNTFIQRGSPAIVLRLIPQEIPNIKTMDLPEILTKIVMNKRGLVILVGATGSGKSTTLAAMVDHRNENSRGHIITIEDPIEILHHHKKCIVTQREVGIDTLGWEDALKDMLRQAPDVILMGEIRDRETMEYAINFSETGHLVLATLHANSANQAMDRILNFFPSDRRSQLLMDLSLNLRSIVAQRLIPRDNAPGRIAAVEILLNTPAIASHIKEGEVDVIKDFMSKSENVGMQTFDQALFKLYENGDISYESALKNADSTNNVRLRIKLESRRKDGPAEDDASGLSIA